MIASCSRSFCTRSLKAKRHEALLGGRSPTIPFLIGPRLFWMYLMYKGRHRVSSKAHRLNVLQTSEMLHRSCASKYFRISKPCSSGKASKYDPLSTIDGSSQC